MLFYRIVLYKILLLKYWLLKKKYEIEDVMFLINEICCIECVKVVLVVFFDDLEFGDYVIFCGIVYDYYGIL